LPTEATSSNHELVPGLSVDELVASTGHERHLLAAVLAEEMRLGRVATLADGSFTLVAGSLPLAVAEGRRGLSRPDVAELVDGTGRARATGGQLSASEWEKISHAVY
jgi:hypothetical protein